MISVIMGIYNCAATLPEAIESILAQTYTDWELIMCDDGSTDNTYEIAKKYVKQFPQKMKLLKNEQNLGLNITLNKCLKMAEGEYIARMDGDDKCHPQRFGKEVMAFENNEDISIVSSDMEFFDENGVWGTTHVKQFPQKKDFVYGTPFCHAASMVKRTAFLAAGGYSVSNRTLRVEDYDLWVKLYDLNFTGMNLQEVLYSMRDDRNAQKRRLMKYRINEAYVKARAIQKFHIGIWGYLYCVVPIAKGCIPPYLYKLLHRLKK